MDIYFDLANRFSYRTRVFYHPFYALVLSRSACLAPEPLKQMMRTLRLLKHLQQCYNCCKYYRRCYLFIIFYILHLRLTCKNSLLLYWRVLKKLWHSNLSCHISFCQNESQFLTADFLLRLQWAGRKLIFPKVKKDR